MKTVKLLVAALFTVTSCLLARVDVYNHLDLPVKVEIHYIGVASPWTGEIEAGGSHVNDYLMKDLANIKTGYVVWVKEKISYRKIISETGLRTLRLVKFYIAYTDQGTDPVIKRRSACN